ncbi:MFS transporter [Lysobacter sp. CA199]|uniref:MFS transporter n=1 Tax=Lysobacter sp. CA199 TaxID=3455608 RepID=UPI003F8D7AB8
MRSGDRLYLLSAGATLSLIGTQISHLAIAARLFELDPSGRLSASLVTLNLLGVAVFGLLAGWALQKITALRAGVAAPIVAALLSLYLFARGQPSSLECLSVAFVQAFVAGLAHPNLMRFLHSRLAHEQRTRFFSFAQSAQQIGLLLAQLAGVLLIQQLGYRWCFLIDAATYLLAAASWMAVRHGAAEAEAEPRPSGKTEFFEGYRLVLTHPQIRGLTLFRFFNHLAYTTFNVALPLWVAAAVAGSGQLPTDLLGQALMASTASMIAASLLGGAALKRRPHWVAHFPWISSLLGVVAVVVAVVAGDARGLLLASLLLGVGLYFFRLCGIVIGAAVTPGRSMAPVIVAGDTLTRVGSFLISLGVPGLALLALPVSPLIPIALLALLAPALTRKAADSARAAVARP